MDHGIFPRFFSVSVMGGMCHWWCYVLIVMLWVGMRAMPGMPVFAVCWVLCSRKFAGGRWTVRFPEDCSKVNVIPTGDTCRWGRTDGRCDRHAARWQGRSRGGRERRRLPGECGRRARPRQQEPGAQGREGAPGAGVGRPPADPRLRAGREDRG